MKCPQCDVDLLLGEKSGIEIDYCPKCRGIWLDRGELEKIVERNNAYYQQAPPTAPPQQQPRYEERPRSDKHYDDDRYRDDYKKYGHKKKDFLSDLFDF